MQYPTIADAENPTFVLHYMAYTKGSTRMMCLFIIIIAAYKLQLELQEHPVLYDSLTQIRVLMTDGLTPEERLVRAMGHLLESNAVFIEVWPQLWDDQHDA